ncbi:15476_t:CDS:2, partial [Dentiscutata erythropus]
GVICLAKSLMHVKTKFSLLVLVPNLENKETNLNCKDYDELIRLGSNYNFWFIDIKEISRIHFKVTPENCVYMKGPIYSESTNKPPITNAKSYFNTRLIILHPSKSKFNKIYDCIINYENSDKLIFLEQDLLNEIYKRNWIGLPYIYNALKPLCKYYSLIWLDNDLKNVHYIINKLWKENFNNVREMRMDERRDILNNWWWKVYQDEELENGDFEVVSA